MKERTRQWIFQNVWNEMWPRLNDPLDRMGSRRRIEHRIWCALAARLTPGYRIGDSLSNEVYQQCCSITREFMMDRGLGW